MLEKLLKQKALIATLLVAVLLGGLFSYFNMGKLEDAEIPIKSAIIITVYPGATAHEVELEVTDVIEKAIQKLDNVDDIISRSLPGYSEVTIAFDEKLKADEMPQIWDYLRKKVIEVNPSLPRSAHKPMVMDDFGDVYGIFSTVTGEGYEYKELYDYVDYMKREFLEIEGVKKIELFGLQTESVDITFSNEKLAGLNINPMLIVQTINDLGQVVNPGSIISGSDRIRIDVGQKFSTIKEIEDVLVQVPYGGSFRLGDITEIKRSFYKPTSEGLAFNGERAISIAISMESGVNVIKIGEKYQEKLKELKTKIPAGIEINSVYYQPEEVRSSINDFILNLIESVVIVVVVLLIAMGFRSGLLIAIGLIFTILATFIVMFVFDIELQKISLGAIIVAMGMLVDNSIVVTDGILVDLKRGIDRRKVFHASALRTAMPLLGATLIAILAFFSLYMSPDTVGIYMESLFTVLAISLFLSWIFAMIQTPFMAGYFHKKNLTQAKTEKSKDPYNSKFYIIFKNIIQYILCHKKTVLMITAVIFAISIYSFRYVKFSFMPTMATKQFLIEYKLPQGTDIIVVQDDLLEISNEIKTWDGVEHITSAVGRTPARYTLNRPINTQASNYGELIVSAVDYETTIVLGKKIINYINEKYPSATIRKRLYGPVFSDYEIEAQFSGPDPEILRGLAEQAKVIMRNEPTATHVVDNWGNKVKVLNPQYSVEQAQKFSISRSDVANTLAIGTNGYIVGAMQEGNTALPIQLKVDNPIGDNIDDLTNIPVWGIYSQNSVPLGQVIAGVDVKWEANEIYRYNNKRAIKVQCDPIDGVLTGVVEATLKPAINAIELPYGYTLEWKGSEAENETAQSNLFKFFPLALGLMLIIVLVLFNNIKQSVIVFAVMPLIIIGIVLGFLVTGSVFNFIGIIGALGLIGMMTKNTIVLLDEINLNLHKGRTQLKSIILAAVSRMRPVVLASLTTMLGMTPLLFDVTFKSLAITIISGLFVGTLITLFIVPVMYALMFKVDISPIKKAINK